MDEIGYVFTPLDLKILLLSVLRRLPGEIESERLMTLCQEIGVVSYFDFSICLDELRESGQVSLEEEYVSITDRGRVTAETLESSLPYSVRRHLEKAVGGEASEMSRQQNISAGHRIENGSCMAEFSLNDGVSEILSLRILCSDEEHARKMEREFKKHAETYYQKIVDLFGERREENT